MGWIFVLNFALAQSTLNTEYFENNEKRHLESANQNADK